MPLINIFLLISFLLSNLANYYSSFVTPLKGGDIDAAKFLTGALEWSQNGEFQLALNTQFFTQYLGFFVRYFEFERFLLSILGIVVFYSSLFICIKYTKRLVLTRQKLMMASNDVTDQYIRMNPLCLEVFRYALLYITLLTPSLILRVGNLAREPYIASGLVIASLCLISQVFYRPFRNKQITISVALICTTIVFIPFHKGSIFFFVISWVLYTCIYIFSDLNPLKFLQDCFFKLTVKRSVLQKSLVALVLSLVVTVFGLMSFNGISDSKATLLIYSAFSADTEQLNKIGLSKSSKEANAQYDYGFDLSNPLNAAWTTIKANVYYYAYPFVPKTSLQAFIFIDNLLRLSVLLALLWHSLQPKISPNTRYAILIILAFFFLCNIVFALGTANYGTGSRHHATLTPILLLTYPFIRRKIATHI